jgi:hypothetical protein
MSNAGCIFGSEIQRGTSPTWLKYTEYLKHDGAERITLKTEDALDPHIIGRYLLAVSPDSCPITHLGAVRSKSCISRAQFIF